MDNFETPPVYYKLFLGETQIVVVTLQDFDERDYDPKRLMSISYANEVVAQQIADSLNAYMHKVFQRSSETAQQHQGSYFAANDPRIYVRRDDRVFRVTIQRNNVWIEQQAPGRPFGGNRPMSTLPDDLYSDGTWNLDVIDLAIEEYEYEIRSDGTSDQ